MGSGPLQGVVAATLTPLGEGGQKLDERAVESLAELYAGAGLDALMVGGSAGEGLLLSRAERERLAGRFLEVAGGRLTVAVHVGAQTTAEATALASHAADRGANAVTAIAPPFFALDDAALMVHFQAIAAACAPLPFYLCEMRRQAGRGIGVRVVRMLLESAPNLTGMKVIAPAAEELAPYLLDGFDVLVGSESLLREGLALGAVGALSGLAGAMPCHVVRALSDPADRGATLGPLRAGLERYPFHAAGKLALVAQSVPMGPDVRPPLRRLTPAEQTELEDWLAGVLASSEGVSA